MPDVTNSVSNWTDDLNRTPNLGAEDGVVSYTNVLSDDIATVDCTDYDFSIPSAAVILGIRVRIKGRENTGGAGLDTPTEVGDSGVQLLKAGTPVGGTRAATPSDVTDDGNNWPTTLTEYTYGDSTDLWDTTWTPGDINDPGFGARFSVNQDDNRSDDRAEVDFVEICVWYEIYKCETYVYCVQYHM